MAQMGVDVLVINLTRFGDLVQSQALVDDLRSSGRKVGLVCLENFASILPLLRGVDMSWRLNGARLRALLDKNWAAAAEFLLNFAKDIMERGKPEYALNLTPSLPARLLSRLLANSGAKMLGFGLDERGFGVNEGVWASFLAVAARKRINSPFNVADLFRMLALPLTGGLSGSHLLAEPNAQSRLWAREFLEKSINQIEKAPKGFVAFQLGASENRRRWPVEHFRELGRRIWSEAEHVPVLLGAPSEKSLAEKYAMGADHPFVDAVGKTDLVQLAAILRECELLATNDTGTMHLAAGQGRPILAFFLATAQPWDTGPLLPDSCCLEPALPCHPCAFGQTCPHDEVCRRAIAPETAANLALSRLARRDWSAGTACASGARIWISGKDDRGMTFIKAAGAVDNERDAWLLCLRQFWRQFLDEIDDGGASRLGKSANKGFEEANNPALRELALSAIPVLKQAAAILAPISELGGIAAKSEKARKLLLLNCERLQTLLENSPPLASLAGFWREFRQSQAGSLEYFLPAAQAFGRHCLALAGALVGVAESKPAGHG